MSLISIKNAVFLDHQKRRLSPINLSLDAGEEKSLGGAQGAALLEYLWKKDVSSLKEGSIFIAAPAFFGPPPKGLLNLKTADFLRSLFLTHNEDAWDSFREVLLKAIGGLCITKKHLKRPLGGLNEEERMHLEYVCLFLKRWQSLVVFPWENGAKIGDFSSFKALLAEKKGCLLTIEKWEG